MEVEEQEYGETGGSGVMVSNLPLLFSRGSPSALFDMSQGELEVFVPFMVRCSVGEERPVPWSHLPRPAWWPKKLPFRMPPSRNSLIGLVQRCYSFHGCDYLLQFCASLVAQMPPAGYRFNDNRDGTTSMYHGTTGKLLVTFRNENRDYDKYRHDGKGRDATKKLLLSPSAHSGGGGGSGGVGGGSTAMIQPDIYLCDKCENNFYSLKEAQAHERQCCGEVPPSPPSPPTPSPEPEVAEEEPEAAGQVPFLDYFNLRPAQHTGLQPYMSPRKKSVSSAPPAKLPGPIYPRYDSIALASPLGRYLFTHSKFRNKYQASQHSVMRYERHLHATPNTDVNFRERCTSRWIVVWRGRKEQQTWVHLYSFNQAQRQERMITIKTGLNKESRRLLRLCRPLSVHVKRLPKRTVDRLKRLGGPTSAPCIDLTDEQHQEVGRMFPSAFNSGLACWPGLGTSGQQSNVQLQWLPGLPPATSVCLPGSSGLPPQITAQVGLTGLTVAPQTSFNFIPFMPGSAQQPQVPTFTLQATPRPLATNNSHFRAPGRGPVRQDGAGPAPSLPLPADVSLIPIRAPVPTRSQLEADLMKPRSRKKFPSHDLLASNLLQPRKQQPQQQQQQQQQQQDGSQMALAFPPQQPQAPQWEVVAPPASSGRAGLTHTLTSSSIEIIDLSSDEDDFGRGGGQGRTEAANAPQQLDGLACYPHTGAKVPTEAAEYYSSSKNGNSHWSSQQKSHCGAGRVGDLATNGQPPNVLPSTPSPHPAPCPQGPHVKGNSRKRKGEEEPPRPWGKTIILDISAQGVTVSEERRSLTLGGSEFCPSQRAVWGTSLGAAAPPVPLPCPSQAEAHTPHAAKSSNSLVVDEEVSFKTPFQIDEDISFSVPQVGPQESGRLTHRNTPDSPPGTPPEDPSQPAGQSATFLASLLTRGVALIRSLVAGKDGMAAAAEAPDTGSHAARESQRQPRHCGTAVAAGAGSPKRASEIQLLLQDECRELQRGGLGELSHLDTQGVRLTRRAVGHIMPWQPSRKTFTPRRCENHPPHRHSAKARREERRSSCKAVVSQAVFGLKAATLGIDENGNSASYVEAGPKQQQQQQWAARECPGLPCIPTCVNNNQKLGGGGGGGSVLIKSTVFSDISLRRCEAAENSHHCAWPPAGGAGTVAGRVECRVSGQGVTEAESPKVGVRSEKKDSLTCSAKVTLEQTKDLAQGRDRVAGGAMANPPWDTSPTKRPVSSHGPAKNVLLARGQTLPLGRPELTGETAEEHGAQQAQCPPPDRPGPSLAGSTTPPGTPSPSKPRLSLLNSLRKGQSSSGHGQHGSTCSPPEQSPRPVLSPLGKPLSTNKKKRSKLSRELSSLSCDEWKEIRGTGFHPSDLLGCEGVKYLSSDDEEVLGPPSRSPSPPGHKQQPLESRMPSPAPKVSREVARLLEDECKELCGTAGRPARSPRDRDRRRVPSMHPLAGLAGLQQDNVDPLDAGGGGSGGGRCSTRSQVNTQPLVEVFTPRDTHRHLLRSEVAMCVLNYMLPNIH
ncbi:uncharacterized protein LOC126986135 [Eriocheir sinensis]|uniref:uncharacterized protein LOC126986135 n=1 Tax=Eriocheir sinensis TaxID=95602 RepID=UPI0021C9EDCA|nr:uncharacterized protein LOC126986135 [Eriocheir sinensis]XP_050697934.1 uncharacterized protein LOC126986135 [Eriocheir sinensis]XP_050697935.1 uncharacterized protein LOC126986135 [Eriocheir sinensis]XP_050697936.1 uncharacterized protein LOC126986135 [Eriocheir sinensis]XP_050697937.1 uncharacterized protein LOC126986135 [Eriocheir sinensis]XP_050697938.1 uncharacterized protein LOC126986135 [Eriocheir sinensis]XP_050697939.1 uncharacterized protein LOC126986135 [Eriocheir sinensis]XP_0